MQNLSRNKKIAFILLVLLFIGISVISIFVAISRSGTNQFGNYITIQNYDDKVKNVSPDVKDAIQFYLYNIVEKNSAAGFDMSSIKDAYIRESSESQTYDKNKDLYVGTFIIDIASIKQSYNTEYSYSETNTVDVGGDPIVISCLPEDKLKFGLFNCTDFVTEQGGKNQEVLQYIPYTGLSFTILPDASTDDNKLILFVTLTIPESDLKGDIASQAQVVALYKNEVAEWFKSKNIDPKEYTIKYNYKDSGEYLGGNFSEN